MRRISSTGMSAAPVTATRRLDRSWSLAIGMVEDRLVERRRTGQHGDPLLGRPGRAPGRRRTPAPGSIVAPAVTEARMPALSPNMWKYGFTIR